MSTVSLDTEILQSWIGLETYDGYKLTQLLSQGSTQVVYKTTHDGREFVMKFSSSHLGFLIGLPPNNLFRINGDPKLPHNAFIQVLTEKDAEYERKLNVRLLSLSGSPLLSSILPLDIIWQKLAFDILQATWYEFHDLSETKRSIIPNLFSRSNKKPTESQKQPRGEHFMQLARHKALIRSNFILERLREWASTDYKTNPLEMITIFAGDEPIHADFPETFVKQSSHALKKIDLLFETLGVGVPKTLIDKNPFLPFIAALSSGYELPSESVTALAKLLDQQVEIPETLLQLGQILHVLTPRWNREQKSQIISFIMAVGSQSTKVGLAELLICMEELK
jgi:hypothetical protein